MPYWATASLSAPVSKPDPIAEALPQGPLSLCADAVVLQVEGGEFSQVGRGRQRRRALGADAVVAQVEGGEPRQVARGRQRRRAGIADAVGQTDDAGGPQVE